MGIVSHLIRPRDVFILSGKEIHGTKRNWKWKPNCTKKNENWMLPPHPHPQNRLTLRHIYLVCWRQESACLQSLRKILGNRYWKWKLNCIKKMKIGCSPPSELTLRHETCLSCVGDRNQHVSMFCAVWGLGGGCTDTTLAAYITIFCGLHRDGKMVASHQTISSQAFCYVKKIEFHVYFQRILI